MIGPGARFGAASGRSLTSPGDPFDPHRDLEEVLP